MPTITLQVGQCGNQLGQALWQAFEQQCPNSSSNAAWALQEGASQFFRLDQHDRRIARCLLVDTEPKVVSGVLQQDSHGIFSRQRCYLGQSGRGNNWAFGYQQVLGTAGGFPGVSSRPTAFSGGGAAGTSAPGSRASPAPTGQVPWNSSALVEDPNQEEHHILEHVVEGIRQECEQCDGAADFLLLHSLGGGSGSGMGSRILEHLRDQYPLNNIATVSVAAQPQGDSPMQSLNSVLALSFLQAYADTVLLFSNQEMIEAAGKSAGAGKGASLGDVNAHIARAVLGALWPLAPRELLGGVSRIRDIVSTVAADVCCKLVEPRTALPAAGGALGWSWQDACRAVVHQYQPFDALDGGRKVTTAGALLLARGFEGSAGTGAGALDPATYIKAAGGRSVFVGQDQPVSELLAMRSGSCMLTAPGKGGQGEKSAPGPCGSNRKPTFVSSPALTAVSSRSSVVGLLGSTVSQASSIWQAGAYLHWYGKYGCGKDAIRTAIEQVSDVVDCYRLLHGFEPQ